MHRDRNVTYRHDGRSVVHDHGRAVHVLQTDRAAIEAALRLAQAKFGPVLKLHGPAHMQWDAAIVAAEAGLYVEFSERSLNDIMQARRVELIAESCKNGRDTSARSFAVARYSASADVWRAEPRGSSDCQCCAQFAIRSTAPRPGRTNPLTIVAVD